MSSETGIARNRSSSPSKQFDAQHRLNARKNRRTYLKAGLFLFLAIIAGMVIGVGVTLLFIKSRMHMQMPKADQIGRSVLKRLRETVELTDDEKSRLEEIILSHMIEVDKVRTESLNAISLEFDEMNEQVDEILGPERSAKWEADKRQHYGKLYRGKDQRYHESSRRAGSPPQPSPGGRRMGPRHQGDEEQ